MKRIVIKSKMRFTMFLLVIFSIGFLTCYSITGYDKVYSKDIKEFSTYTVGRNDTLWDIARREGNEKEDIRKTIYKIRKYNNINSNIVVGQKIKIPH